jgi:hypothetical protein
MSFTIYPVGYDYISIQMKACPSLQSNFRRRVRQAMVIQTIIDEIAVLDRLVPDAVGLSVIPVCCLRDGWYSK